MSGLTNYNVKDPFGNFIDLSYIFMPSVGYQLLTNLKSNGIDIGPLFKPLITVTDLSTNAIVQPNASDSNYLYYRFDTVGTNNNKGYLITNGNFGNLYYVAIGGGGGGGRGRNAASASGGGGGGAGAMLHGKLIGISASSTIYINVGDGGLGSTNSSVQGGSGGQTDISFNTTKIIAGGGGGGGCSDGTKTGLNGSNNSSGGGGSNTGAGGLKNGIGYKGGAGSQGSGAGGGGGGGASGDGADGTVFSNGVWGGQGGAGVSVNSKLTGATAYTTNYCVGGGGSGGASGTNGATISEYGSGGAGGIGVDAINGFKGAVFLAYSILQ